MTLIIAIVISVLYCEWIWKSAVEKKKINDVKIYLKWLAIFNFALAIVLSWFSNLIFAIIIALYQMVIIEKREAKLNGRVVE
jgi:membrane protein insertase Oxa1/YidC/SpoIIIJ